MGRNRVVTWAEAQAARQSGKIEVIAPSAPSAKKAS
jgi:hypothetical protein